MNEITRIHLAKVPYNIEIEAKKQLQKYIDAISVYSGDQELAQDVESRMVELLAERKIAAEGTITLNDVQAIQAQLGEPEAFSEEEVIVEENGKPAHRLFRDTTQAWLGGVAAGIGRYFGVNPLWIRLAFIVLALFSFGTIVLIYVVLWLIIPPIKTVADILQLEGRATTITAIHALNEAGTEIPTGRDRRIARGASIVAGVGISLWALGLLALIIVVSAVAVAHHNIADFLPGNQTISVLVCLAFVVGVLLFVLLLALIAYFLFSWRWTKRLWIAGLVVIVLGLAAVGIVVTGRITDNAALQQRLDSLTRTTTTSLPTSFRGVTNVSINTEGVDQVTYVVSNRAQITVSALPGGRTPKVSINGASASIQLNETGAAYRIGSNSAVGHQATVTIYGPALQGVTVEGGVFTYELIDGSVAPTFTAHVHPGAQLSIEGGNIESLTAVLGSTAAFDATSATVHAATVSLDTGTNALLGNISSLVVTAPDACPVDGSLASIEVGGVNDSHVTYNDKQIAKQSITNACAELTIDN